MKKLKIDFDEIQKAMEDVVRDTFDYFLDIETGEVKVLRIIAAHNVGKAIHPENVRGQIYGGITMGLGMALTEQFEIKEGKPITITDPYMTRFMMSLDDAINLVTYAFNNAKQGDIFVQKAPAATINDLAVALKELFKANNEIRIIGTRHGEKLHETLLTREELAKAEDCGDYYRISPDDRDLNYSKYFTEGQEQVSLMEDYNSFNTRRINVEEIKVMLLKLDYIQHELSTGANQ